MSPTSADTLTRLMDVAQDLVQRRGINAMSFQDLSEAVGIRKASVHYHFPSKDDMVVKLLERYREQFGQNVQAILRGNYSGAEKLKKYAGLFCGPLQQPPYDRGCLCGMLAAEMITLSESAAESVRSFFEENQAWIRTILDTGIEDGSLKLGGSSKAAAQFIFASLEGALLIARTQGGMKRMQADTRTLLQLFRP
ncbi:MAG: TetR/AcrR family transcriptional regulator [Planctomycetota bacterium]